jgi:hypothetical protein
MLAAHYVLDCDRLQQLAHFQFNLESCTLDGLFARLWRDGKCGLKERHYEKTAVGDFATGRHYGILGHCGKRRASDEHV